MARASAAGSDVATFEGALPSPADRARFARTMAYLDALPDGIDSYPHCRGRSGVLATFRGGIPPFAGGPHPFLEALLRPSPRPYVREVVLNAALLAIADQAGMTDGQFVAWDRATMSEVYRGLFFRALMAIFSPAKLLERAPARWEAFHQGTTLGVRRAGPNEALVALTFPRRLFTPLLLQTYAGAFAAALVHARAPWADVELASSTETAAEFVARWQ